jgi:uncharacterized protein YndB with AHSA1/START domain
MNSKIQYELEVSIHASPQLLYPYIATPSGLSEWFADNVNSRGEYYTFIWDDSEENARVQHKKTNERIRFIWLDDNNKDTDYFFEIRIVEDEITKDVSIMVIDFAEADDIVASKSLWANQISELKHLIGAA